MVFSITSICYSFVSHPGAKLIPSLLKQCHHSICHSYGFKDISEWKGSNPGASTSDLQLIYLVLISFSKNRRRMDNMKLFLVTDSQDKDTSHFMLLFAKKSVKPFTAASAAVSGPSSFAMSPPPLQCRLLFSMDHYEEPKQTTTCKQQLL